MRESTEKALRAAEMALLELTPSHRGMGCWCAWGYDHRLQHSPRCRKAGEALELVRAALARLEGK